MGKIGNVNNNDKEDSYLKSQVLDYQCVKAGVLGLGL